MLTGPTIQGKASIKYRGLKMLKMFALIAALAAATGAPAALVLERFPAAGPAPVGTSITGYSIYPESYIAYGQTIRPQARGRILRFDFLGSSYSPVTPTLPYSLEVYAGVGGALLAQQTFAIPGTLGAALAWVPVDLGGRSLQAKPGQQLFFTLSGGDDNGYVGWLGLSGSSSALYPRGNAYSRQTCTSFPLNSPGCDTWQVRQVQGNDFDFGYRLLIDDAAAVPEPTTWGLLIAGFGLLGAWQRRGSHRGSVSVTRARLEGSA